MIVLGFLSYNDGYVKIPNKELMKEFEKALKDKSFGYVSEIIENSKKNAKINYMKVKQKLLKKYFMIFIIQKYRFYSIMMRIVYLVSLL